MHRNSCTNRITLKYCNCSGRPSLHMIFSSFSFFCSRPSAQIVIKTKVYKRRGITKVWKWNKWHWVCGRYVTGDQRGKGLWENKGGEGECGQLKIHFLYSRVRGQKLSIGLFFCYPNGFKSNPLPSHSWVCPLCCQEQKCNFSSTHVFRYSPEP